MIFLKKIVKKATPPKVYFSFSLKKQIFVPGDDIEGTLHIHSQEDFDCDEIRCEFEVAEIICADGDFYEGCFYEIRSSFFLSNLQLSGPIHIYKNFKEKYPFKFQTPVELPPTYRSKRKKISWLLRGVVVTKDRPNAVGEIELQFFKAPSKQATRQIQKVRMIKCEYCGTLFPENEIKCPNCGAFRKIK